MLTGETLEQALKKLVATKQQGTGYRIIPAQFHLTALSAIGALQRGGRYNPRGRLEAIYLSDTPITALQEVEAVAITSAGLIGLRTNPKTILSVDSKYTSKVEAKEGPRQNREHVER
jgi:RES domain-containing protein